MGLTVAVDHRVLRARSHDGATHQVNGRDIAAARPHLLRARALGDGQPLREVRLPQLRHLVVVAVNDAAERHAELVLFARHLDTVLDVRHLLAEGPDAGKAAGAFFHELGKGGPEQVDTRIGHAAEIAGLDRGAGDDEARAERAPVRGLAVAVIGHELRAGRAHVVLHILVEDRERARREVGHHVFADQPVAVGEALGVLVGRRVEQEAWVLRRPGREHDHARLLHLALLLAIVIFDPGHLGPFGIGEDAGDAAPGPHLGAGAGQVHHRSFPPTYPFLPLAACFTPVSYTHLDVYKRQGLARAAPLPRPSSAAQAASTGRAKAMRQKPAAAGPTSAKRTKMPEKPMQVAPVISLSLIHI